jgi:hypothetical protein
MNTLNNLVTGVQITANRGEAVTAWDKRDKWQQEANDWRVTLQYQGRRYSLDFWQGVGIKDAPTAQGVLECLLSDTQSAYGSFNDFCSNMGYSEDSIKAKRIYDACHRQDKRLKKLFGADYQAFVDSER